MKRILVVGTSCAGKSTFARALAQRLGCACVELDALFWGPRWTPKPLAEFLALVAAAAGADRWIVEGNYGDARDVLWPRATTVVWLDYPLPVVLWRAVRRTVHRVRTGQELWHGNRESFRQAFLSRDSILAWVVRTHHRRRAQFAALRAANAYPQLEWVALRSPAAAARYLDGVPRAG